MQVNRARKTEKEKKMKGTKEKKRERDHPLVSISY